MKKFILTGAAVALFLAPTAVAPASTVRMSTNHHRYVCHRLYTVKMDIKAARYIYRGTRSPSKHNLHQLGKYERCQQNPQARWYVRWYNHHQAQENQARRKQAARIAAQQKYVTRYNGWAIPSRIVYCESGYQNLAPNSASASGYYQMTDSTWQGWAAAAGLTNYPAEAYQASRTDQGLAAGWGWDHDGSSPWSPSSGCSGY